MSKRKFKKNARIQGLLYFFAGINALLAALLGGGDKGLLYISGAGEFSLGDRDSLFPGTCPMRVYVA